MYVVKLIMSGNHTHSFGYCDYLWTEGVKCLVGIYVYL